MADGTYERRGPREAEIKRLARLIAETRTAVVRTRNVAKLPRDSQSG